MVTPGTRADDAAAVAVGVVAAQRGENAGVQRNEAGLAEFALPHGHDAREQIYVAAGEAPRLGDAQAGRGEEAEERHKGAGPQAAAGPQLCGGAEQSSDFAGGVDVGRLSPIAGPEQPQRRNFRGRIEESAVPSEPADDVEAPRGR